MNAQLDTCPAPSHGWTCFYCGETFTGRIDAENHFGRWEGAEPACKIKAAGEFALLQALRNAEDELNRHRADDSDTLRAMHSMIADHQVALRREEEKGYERGLRDARSAAETPAPQFRCLAMLNHPLKLCEDCPPAAHPTDKTRCAECPRRAGPTEARHGD